MTLAKNTASFAARERASRRLAVLLALAPLILHAAGTVTTTGDVIPSPATSPVWTVSGTLIVGNTGTGSVTVNGGKVDAGSGDIVLGQNAGSLGTVSLTSGTWLGTESYIGYDGIGSLSATNSYVNIVNEIDVGEDAGSVGTANFVNSTVSTDSLFVGAFGGSGSFGFNGGLLINSYAYLGYSLGSSGTVTFSSGTWQTSYISVGIKGAGTLNIQGGLVTGQEGDVADDFTGFGASQSEGTVNVTGGTWQNTGNLYVGTTGTGTLNIQGGFVTDAIGYLGYGSVSNPSSGSASVTSGTWQNTGALYVGYRSPGTLTIGTGGLVTDSDAYLETDGDHVSVTSGTWRNSGSLYVGYDSTGTSSLDIEGGFVSAATSYVGYNFSNNGEPFVTVNSGTWQNSGDLHVGYSGSGLLTIDGGYVSDAGGHIGTQISGQGTVHVVSGTWQNSGTLTIGDAGQGTLDLDGGFVSDAAAIVGAQNQGSVLMTGGTWSAGALTIGSANQSTGTVSLAGGYLSNQQAILGAQSGAQGAAFVTGGTWQNYNLTVGQSGTGTLTISGGLVNSDNSTVLGQNAGSLGTVTVTGGMFQNLNLAIGYFGDGVLNIESGTVSSTYTYIDSAGGSGVLTLSGSAGQRGVLETGELLRNYFTGGGHVTFDGGILRALGDSSEFLGNFDLGDITIDAGGAFIDSQGYSITADSGFSGTGGLTKLGPGTLTLSGTSDYSGGTTLAGGSLVAGVSGALVSGTTGADYTFAGGSLDLNGYSITMSSLSGTGGGLALGTGTLTVAQTGSTAFAGSITGSGGFTKLGTGTLTLSGSSDFGGALSPDEGTLIITGQVTSGQTSGIATTGATAIVNITGTAARWTSDADTFIGLNGGTGYLNITDGGIASDSFALVGRAAGNTGHVTVSGPGSLWTHTAGIVIGTGGDGTLLVENGGQVSNADGTIGGDATASGSAQVTGAGSLWTSTSYLIVGSSGTGVLNIDSGGTVQVGSTGAGTMTLGNSGAGSGILNIGGAVGAPALDPGLVAGATVTGGSGSGDKLVNFNHTSTGYIFAPTLAGSLRVEQNSGNTILTGPNTYTGGTQINSGTLTLNDARGAGTGGVAVAAGGTLLVDSDSAIANQVTLAGGTYAHTLSVGSSLAGAVDATSAVGGVTTSASILTGTLSAAATVQASFSNTSGAVNDQIRITPVYTLSGLPIVSIPTNQTDIFVLQLTASNLTDKNQVIWLDPDTNTWINAAAADPAVAALFAGDHAFDPITDFHLGTWGVDSADHTVWAVVDHAGDYAAPEPSTWALLGASALAFTLFRRRRRP